MKVSLLYRGVLYVEVILYSKECNWYTRCCLLNGGVHYRVSIKRGSTCIYMYTCTCTLYLPSPSTLPMSPECNHPSSSSASFVFSSLSRYPINTLRPRKQISPSPVSGSGSEILTSTPFNA